MGGGGGKGGGKGGGGGGADAMLEYGNKALDLQKDIYGQSRKDAQPWYQAGTGAVNKLSSLMGVNNAANTYKFSDPVYQKKLERMSGNARDYAQWGDAQGMADAIKRKYGVQYETIPGQGEQGEGFGSLLKPFGMDDYQADPGYQFRLEQGQKALDRRMNAQGKTFSPEAAKAMNEYNSGMASQEYGQAYNRYNINQDSLYNRLAGLAGMGQTATGQLQNAGGNYAQGATDLYTGMGNAVTSAGLANQANNSSMFGSLLGAGAQLGSAAIFSDRRLKVGISDYDERNGYKRYKFAYRNNPEKYFIGVMADEVLKQDPLAVEMDEESGYYMVDYGKIGFEMEEA